MKRINIIIWALSLLTSIAFIIACDNTYMGLEQKQTDSVSPGKLTVGSVIPHSGALEIFFTLPAEDLDIAQVVGSYVNKRGETVEFTASRYTQSILVEGFTGTDEVEVDLKCVDNSGNESEIVKVKGNPLISPVEVARQSLAVETAFGGVKVDWENKSGDLIVIHVLTEDALQVGKVTLEEDPAQRIYTSDTASNRTYAYVRQYPDTEQKFGFTISDKWGNSTDTLIGAWTPYKEDVISTMSMSGSTHIEEVTAFGGIVYCQSVSKDYDSEGMVPGTNIQRDGYFHASWYRPNTMFNKSLSNGPHFTRFTKNLLDDDPDNDEYVLSSFITYNLNIDARLSRFNIHPRKPIAFESGSPKRFKIWGTDDSNLNKYDQFPEGWTLIGEYVRPEPAIPGAPSDEERESAYTEGVEFNVVDDNVNPNASPATSFRYMRLEFTETYGVNETGKIICLQEMELWGAIVKKYYME